MRTRAVAFRAFVLIAMVAGCVRSAQDTGAPPPVAPQLSVEAPPPSDLPAHLATPEPPPTSAPTPPPANAGSVFGRMRRSDDDSVVAGQRITLLDADGVERETTTDALGMFEFDGVEPDRPFELRARTPECAAVRLPCLVVEGDERRDVGTLRLGPPIRLVVRVRSWGDDAVAGARVLAFRRPARSSSRDDSWSLSDRHGRYPEPVAQSVTAASGDATFADTAEGEWAFVAHAPGFATQGVMVHVGPRAAVTLTIRVETGASLEGRILDADGAPASGATVALGGWMGFDAWRPSRVIADSDGRFAFDGVASGEHSIFGGPRGAPTFRLARVSVPDVRHLELRLPKPCVARGVVVDVDTALPIEGARVRCAAADGEIEATSDAQGRYEISVWAPEGEYHGFGVEKHGYGEPKDESERRVAYRLRPGDVLARDFRLRRGAPSDPLRNGAPSAHAPAGSILGVVVDADGAPVSGAEVRGSDMGSAVTDDAGAFRFDDVAPGRHSIDAVGLNARGRAEVAVKSERRSDVTVRLGPSDVVVRGRLRFADGAAPPPGTRVRTYWDVASGSDGGRSPAAPVRADGSFVVGAARDATRFRIRAEVPGLIPWAWDDEGIWPARTDGSWVTTVEGCSEYERNVAVPGGAALSGRVVAKEGGAPIAGAWILVRQCCILGSPYNPVRATTDADGRFSIPHAYERRWAVGVEAPGFAPFAVWMDAGSAPMTFALERSLSVEGVVRLADGRPAVGAVVRAVREDCSPLNPSGREDRSEGTVDSAGRFRVTELPPGRFTLVAGPRSTSNEFVLPTRVSDVAAGSSDLRMVVALGASISGRVVDPKGTPIVDAQVRATRVGPAVPDDAWHSTKSGPDGRFELRGLAPGEYGISVSRYWEGRPGHVETQMPPVSAGRTGLEVVLAESATVAGVLVDAAGEPLGERWVELRPVGLAGAAGTRTDVGGVFVVDGLPPGEYEAWVLTDGVKANAVRCGTVRAGDAGVTLRLPR